MEALKHVVCRTPDEIEQDAEARRSEAMKLEPGTARQSILRDVAEMRQCALMKPVLQPQQS